MKGIQNDFGASKAPGGTMKTKQQTRSAALAAFAAAAMAVSAAAQTTPAPVDTPPGPGPITTPGPLPPWRSPFSPIAPGGPGGGYMSPYGNQTMYNVERGVGILERIGGWVRQLQPTMTINTSAVGSVVPPYTAVSAEAARDWNWNRDWDRLACPDRPQAITFPIPGGRGEFTLNVNTNCALIVEANGTRAFAPNDGRYIKHVSYSINRLDTFMRNYEFAARVVDVWNSSSDPDRPVAGMIFQIFWKTNAMVWADQRSATFEIYGAPVGNGANAGTVFLFDGGNAPIAPIGANFDNPDRPALDSRGAIRGRQTQASATEARAMRDRQACEGPVGAALCGIAATGGYNGGGGGW